jgi:hypothetical protein
MSMESSTTRATNDIKRPAGKQTPLIRPTAE